MHTLLVPLAVQLPAWSRDVSGYVASALVLSTFSVRSMRWLRILGIASNVSFISYAVVAVMPPILILHMLLLPMNIYRLVQLERQRAGTASTVRRVGLLEGQAS